MVFNLWIGPGFFFLSLIVDFKFFNSHFPVTTLGLDLSSDANRNKFTASVACSD
jgi:hypothetical protein